MQRLMQPEETLGSRHMTRTLALEMNAWLIVLVVSMCLRCYPNKFIQTLNIKSYVCILFHNCYIENTPFLTQIMNYVT